jgi:hypothetical protein
MILENISDDFCRSLPYQSIYFEQLISTVSSICESFSNIDLVIRTRNKDKVYYIAKKFSSFITISTQISVKIEDDISKANIVITQYSNAINEALIFGKSVIQVNLYKIHDWHSELQNSNICRVDSIEELIKKLPVIIRSKRHKSLNSIDSNEYYFNSFQHQPYQPTKSEL